MFQNSQASPNGHTCTGSKHFVVMERFDKVGIHIKILPITWNFCQSKEMESILVMDGWHEYKVYRVKLYILGICSNPFVVMEKFDREGMPH